MSKKTKAELEEQIENLYAQIEDYDQIICEKESEIETLFNEKESEIEILKKEVRDCKDELVRLQCNESNLIDVIVNLTEKKGS